MGIVMKWREQVKKDVETNERIWRALLSKADGSLLERYHGAVMCIFFAVGTAAGMGIGSHSAEASPGSVTYWLLVGFWLLMLAVFAIGSIYLAWFWAKHWSPAEKAVRAADAQTDKGEA